MNKRIIITTIGVLLSLCTFTSCSSGDYKDFEYVINADDTISLTKYTGRKTYVDVPSKIKGKEVTVIENGCFNNYELLEKLYIPDSIKQINSTFSSSEYLTEVHIDSVEQWLDTKLLSYNSNPLYHNDLYINDKKIDTLIIPEGTTHINNYAFKGANISQVNLPKSLKSIGYQGLNSSSLKRINITDLSAYCALDLDQAFDFDCNLLLNDKIVENLVIPEDVKEIKQEVFYQFSFKSISLNEGLEILDDNCFGNNIDVKGELKLPSTLKKIGSHSLSAFYNVDKITIPNSVNSIGYGAFFYDSKLKECNIPEGIKDLPINIFGHCTSLEKVNLPNSLETIGNNSFMNCGKLNELILGDNVTSIGSGAFDRCESLTEIIIPASVTTIESNAFIDCNNLVIKTPLSEIPEGWEKDFKDESIKIIFNYAK